MTLWQHIVITAAVGLTVAGLLGLATAMSRERELGGLLTTLLWRAGFPVFLGLEAANAADRGRWVGVAFYIAGAWAALGVAMWDRRRRT